MLQARAASRSLLVWVTMLLTPASYAATGNAGVDQPAAGSCLFSLSSTSVSLPNGSGTFTSPTGSFNVVATGCLISDTWTAASDSPRLAVTSGASGNGATGTTTVDLSLFTNSTTLAQTFHVNVSGMMNGSSFLLTFTVTQAGSTETQTQRVVRALYQTILGREPDADGWAFWTGSGVQLNVMADDFYRSAEFQGNGFAVFAIFTSVLGRLPNFTEWSGNTTAFRNQTATPAQLISALAGPVSSEAFVQKVIQNGLGRPATAAEIIFYGAQLNSGETQYDFLNSVIFTDPAFQGSTNAAFVAMLYYTILVRNYDAGGFNFWVGVATNPPGQGGIYYVFNQPAGAYAVKLGMIGQAAPPNPAEQGFLGSPEFQALIQ